MGFRLRKSINLGGGVRINLSKSGVGYSWGTKGFRVTKTANGKTRKTYSIPGTGISYVDETSNARKDASSVAHPLFCRECGTKLGDNSNFCTQCGAKVVK